MNREPVAIAAAVRAVVLAAVAFGLDWTGEQVAALMLAVEAALALVVRQQVTPTGSAGGDRGHADPWGLAATALIAAAVTIVILVAWGEDLIR